MPQLKKNEFIVISGLMREASDIKGIVVLEPADSKPVKVRVSEGLDDLVSIYWNKPVSATVRKKGRGFELINLMPT